MTLQIPLAVRLSTSRADRHVTAQVRDLTFGWTDPGGYASCRIGLDRPLAIQPDDIAYYGDVVVYDTRSGATVWDGRLEDPGRTAGANGQVWDLTAIGGQTHAHDRTLPLIYVDTDLTRWTPVEVTQLPAGQRSTGETETVFPGEVSLVHQIPNGTPVVTNTSLIGARYLPIYHAGQRLALIDYQWDAGRTTTSLRIRSLARLGAAWFTNTVLRDEAANTAGGGFNPQVIDTDWPIGRDVPEVRLQWTGANTTIADHVTWAAWAGLVVQATRYDVSGTELTTGASYATNTVLASEVVADLLGRLLPMWDGPGATITTTTHPIDQLAYPSGVTPAKVLADLVALDAGFTWRVWERNSDGLFRFEWVELPTSVRYEATVTDGFDSPASVEGLFNAVTVRWVDAAGATRTTVRTTTVPDLDDAGITRQGFLDLGDEAGTEGNAEEAGDNWLAERQYPPNAGRLTIARRILDRDTGRMVDPWEIQPGLIRVRGVQPRVDALNPVGRDGVTVFRIVACEYRTSDASAVLDLDSYPYSVANSLAALQTARVRR